MALIMLGKSEGNHTLVEKEKFYIESLNESWIRQDYSKDPIQLEETYVTVCQDNKE